MSRSLDRWQSVMNRRVGHAEASLAPTGAIRMPLATFHDARWRNWPAQAILMALAFLVALFVRAPGLLLAPRFWAEEGHSYHAALHDPAVSPLTLVVGGNYQLLINIAEQAAKLMRVCLALTCSDVALDAPKTLTSSTVQSACARQGTTG